MVGSIGFLSCRNFPGVKTMKKCKKHEYCKYKGKNKNHLGCRWHGMIDSCTNDMTRAPEYQKLFDDGHLAIALPTKYDCLTEEKQSLKVSDGSQPIKIFLMCLFILVVIRVSYQVITLLEQIVINTTK